jgi:flagellin-like hook-associated protein FlgL
MSGISSIDTKIINILANYGSKSKSSAVSQGGSDDPIRTSLRTGAQTYALAVRGLNTLASYINVARSSMEQLDNITDRLITIVEQAKKGSTSSQTRNDLQLQYTRLVKAFQTTVETARVQDQDLLSVDGLTSVFQTFGLDKEQSASISDLFKLFKTPDDDSSLASQEIQGARPVSIPEEAFNTPKSVSRQTTNFEEIFDSERLINERPEAYRVAVDLAALKRQITKNVKALDESTEVILSNIKLAQGAGFAFLDASNTQGIGSPEEAAQIVRDKIRRNASGALAQADNLEPLLVAALVLEQNGAFSDG